jgi:plasmid segregation protein ParM
MKQEVVDLLVVGLPVAQYMLRRAALEKAMTGVFDVGRGRQVTVRKVLVVAQPQGALFSYAAESGRLAETLGQRSLVIDAGTRTFDWLVTHGMRVMPSLSYSVNRGVADILRVIAEGISTDIGEPYTDHDAIDLALRTKKPLRIYQRAYDIRRHVVTAEKIAEQAVTSMLERLGSSHGFEHVVLVGGGAFLFRKALKVRLPKMTVTEVAEPLYANVKGFQLLGEQYAREKGLTAAVPARELAPAASAAQVPVDGVSADAALEGQA